METKTKTGPVPRAVVKAFYHALANRDMGTLATFLDEQVVWTISGPVDMLPFCGQRIGKAVVMKLLVRDIPTFLSDRLAEYHAGGRRSRRRAWQAQRDQAR